MPKHIVLGRALLCASFPLYAAPAFAAELASDTSTDNDAVSTAPLVITVTAPTAIKDSRKGPASATFVSDPMETSSPVLLETGEYLRSVPGVTSRSRWRAWVRAGHSRPATEPAHGHRQWGPGLWRVSGAHGSAYLVGAALAPLTE